ncbi:hypothetical protein [Microlunatus sp. GCM10028923]
MTPGIRLAVSGRADSGEILVDLEVPDERYDTDTFPRSATGP